MSDDTLADVVRHPDGEPVTVTIVMPDGTVAKRALTYSGPPLVYMDGAGFVPMEDKDDR